MKNTKLILVVGLMLIAFGFACSAQKSEMKNIEKVITEFAKAGDENNAENLANYLDDNYRVVMNRLFGSEEVSILSLSVYLEKIRSKEFGGDTRVLTIENVVVNGATATAQVTMKGTKMTLVSMLSLVQDAAGKWKLISDMPIIK